MAKRKGQDRIVAAYTRVSSDRQSDRSQQHELQAYIENHGLSNVRWYRDKLSGKDLERPAMKRLQADIFDGRVSTVLCWKLDRLSRSMKDGINVLVDWCERGIRVVSTTQQLDLSGVTGRMVAALLLGIGEMERENISERIRVGLAARKARGLSMGRRKGQSFPWSPSKRKVDVAVCRSLRVQGVKVVDIASRFGCSVQCVYMALRALNKK